MAIGPVMAKRKRSEHYVNNKEFLAALIKYREDKEIAALKDLPKPELTPVINIFNLCNPPKVFYQNYPYLIHQL